MPIFYILYICQMRTVSLITLVFFLFTPPSIVLQLYIDPNLFVLIIHVLFLGSAM